VVAGFAGGRRRGLRHARHESASFQRRSASTCAWAKSVLGVFGLALGEHLEAVFRHADNPAPRHFGGAAVELQRVLAAVGPARVVAVQQPLAGFDGELLLLGADAACPASMPWAMQWL
jgi:hypothetical protein